MARLQTITRLYPGAKKASPLPHPAPVKLCQERDGFRGGHTDFMCIGPPLPSLSIRYSGEIDDRNPIRSANK